MQLNMSELTSYINDTQRAKAALQKAKRDYDYARLQAKNTRQSAARAKKSQHIKAIVHALTPSDSVEVLPTPGTVWVSFSAGGILKLDNMSQPGQLGWQEYRTEAPDLRYTHHYYKHPDAPGVVLIISESHV